MNPQDRYALRGVSAQKEEVHKAVADLDKGLFPKAFCKIYPDFWAGDAAYCNIMHADGAGTKSILAYLYWKETGDLSVWKGIAIDSIVMNIDDMLCVGATGPFTYSSTIGRNKHLIPGEVIAEIINGSQSYFDTLKEYGIETHFMGLNQDLYGEQVTIEFLKFIREEQTFDSIETLRQEIVKDEKFAMQFLKNRG